MASFLRGDMCIYTPLASPTHGGPEHVRVLGVALTAPGAVPVYVVHGVEDPFFMHSFNAATTELVADASKTALQHGLRPLPR
jgi:hypothetical protein